uniref:Uncharacterized protein n=1 Tax=Mycena chlorophos TaxID=658473 RepID=A0ABQ0L2I5_MYCCL|nr:predicted protein [Mycena chlorophos]
MYSHVSYTPTQLLSSSCHTTWHALEQLLRFSACISIEGRVTGTDKFATTVSPDKKRVTYWIASEVGKGRAVAPSCGQRDAVGGYLGWSNDTTLHDWRFRALWSAFRSLTETWRAECAVSRRRHGDTGTVILSISPVAHFQEAVYVPAESLPQTTAHASAMKFGGTYRVELGEGQQLPQPRQWSHSVSFNDPLGPDDEDEAFASMSARTTRRAAIRLGGGAEQEHRPLAEEASGGRLTLRRWREDEHAARHPEPSHGQGCYVQAGEDSE